MPYEITAPPSLPEFKGFNTGLSNTSSIQGLMAEASEMVRQRPATVTHLNDGSFRLRAPLPLGYQPKLNRKATELVARVNASGLIFEIAEKSPGISGGWMASCIPSSMYQIFLKSWLEDARGQAQGSLFS